MARKVKVSLYGQVAGLLVQDEHGYRFTYDENYRGHSLSLSLPVSQKTFKSEILHPFFKSLAPEGWLLTQYSQLQKIDERDLLGILLANGKDLLGAVTMERLDL